MKKIIAIICLLCCILLCACGGEQAEESSSTTEISNFPKDIVLANGKTAAYDIIIPQDCSDELKSTASGLAQKLQTTTGALFRVTDDTSAVPENKGEIIVGACSREDTEATLDGIFYRDYKVFLLELSTGMRKGEILGLKWGDLNLDTGELRISREVVRANSKTLVTPPKTKSSIRTVVLPPYMVEMLAKMKATAKYDWIFPSPVNLGEPRNPSAIYHRCQLILERASCKKVRFHDLRHTFATMAIENGMDIKTLSDMIGHISSETTLNIYSHITDTMREQAAAKIDRKIGGTDAPIPESKPVTAPTPNKAVNENFEPYKPKYRKPGTGCVTMINDHLYEGRYTPNVNGKRISRNVYAKTREECEEKLAELIKTMKAEIAEMKAKATA